ncbi:class I SAM-dependent methyltransferase [Glycomyces buryatensis]|uniref:Class I SAM-dependent methyltransferase n=1 Tax=Glycomyces buryatensis TaxID=2570927 RepID=A0A4S8QFQ4_9ACTN|nr:class I SAM-dependent methyltransferase [Glycomyces buryatensis]THV42511.1 class I SAM-dependent methyltransferase [Glycomyces buryatensis]
MRVRTLDDLRRFWDKQAHRYDHAMEWAERRFFDGTREWITERATGQVLEVAIGTGLNLPHYSKGVELTGIELSPGMLALAKRRAASLGLDVDLRLGDAQELDFEDASFDTVVCTFSLCTIPDDAKAVGEMIRVLRPGGRLLLADHVESTSAWVRGIQRVIETGSVPFQGEHFRRHPSRHVEAAGLDIEARDRFKKGLIERLVARKPAAE